MRRTRFKHHVDILCRMFCGWQLYSDFDKFAELGSGILEINAKDGQCHYNSKAISKLSIATTLCSWFNEELLENHIASNEIVAVMLTVKIKVFPPEYGKRFTAFIFDCKSKIVSGTDVYENKYTDEQQYECKRI